MATDTVSRAAGAQSPAVPDSIGAAAEAPSTAAFLELNKLLEQLLNLVSNLRGADGVLFDLQAVPEPRSRAPASSVHDAIENLAALHSRLEEWCIKADRGARVAGAVARCAGCRGARSLGAAHREPTPAYCLT